MLHVFEINIVLTRLKIDYLYNAQFCYDFLHYIITFWEKVQHFKNYKGYKVTMKVIAHKWYEEI